MVGSSYDDPMVLSDSESDLEPVLTPMSIVGASSGSKDEHTVVSSPKLRILPDGTLVPDPNLHSATDGSYDPLRDYCSGCAEAMEGDWYSDAGNEDVAAVDAEDGDEDDVDSDPEEDPSEELEGDEDEGDEVELEAMRAESDGEPVVAEGVADGVAIGEEVESEGEQFDHEGVEEMMSNENGGNEEATEGDTDGEAEGAEGVEVEDVGEDDDHVDFAWGAPVVAEGIAEEVANEGVPEGAEQLGGIPEGVEDLAQEDWDMDVGGDVGDNFSEVSSQGEPHLSEMGQLRRHCEIMQQAMDDAHRELNRVRSIMRERQLLRIDEAAAGVRARRAYEESYRTLRMTLQAATDRTGMIPWETVARLVTEAQARGLGAV